ncbi:MAG: helix-hairpin-helix domain-containing protein [Planctomycetota bacterium]
MRRRGVVIVVVLWVVAILAVVCLALAGSVRFQQTHYRRTRDDVQSNEALRAGLAQARALLEADDLAADTLEEPWAQAPPEITLSSRRVRLLSDQDSGESAGLADEAARLNANTASAEMLARLPGMTAAAAEALVEIRNSAEIAGDPLGAAVDGPTGRLASPAQLADALRYALGQAGLLSATGESGWEGEQSDPVADVARYLTVYSRQWNTDAQGRPRVNLNTADRAELLRAVEDVLTSRQVDALLAARNRRPFESIGEMLTRELTVVEADGARVQVEIDPGAFRQIADRLTTTASDILLGRVNINTAPREVLQALPGLAKADAEAIVAARAQQDAPQSVAWLLDVLDPETFETVCPYVTTRSWQFRACIEAAPQSAGDSQKDAARSRALAVLERDAGRTAVLLWLTWHAWDAETDR